MAGQRRAEAVKKQGKRAVSKIAKYKEVFETPTGKWVLADMMAAHGMLAAHPIDAQKAALKEGERLVCLRILSFLKEDPTKLMERIEEYERSLVSEI